VETAAKSRRRVVIVVVVVIVVAAATVTVSVVMVPVTDGAGETVSGRLSGRVPYYWSCARNWPERGRAGAGPSFGGSSLCRNVERLLVVLLELVVNGVVRVVHQFGGAGADVHVHEAAAAALDGTEGVDRCC
jgi:hypothetical protein